MMNVHAFEFQTPDGFRLERPTGRVAEALRFLEDLPPYDLAADDFNANIMGQRPIDFVRERVRVIVFDTRADSPECEDGRLAFVHPVYRATKKMWVCPLVERYDLVTVTATLVHEARHEDGPAYDHQPCRQGPNRGKMACDESYASEGSYAVGLEYLVKLARHPGVAPEIRAQARTAAVRDFLSRFNEAPLDVRNGALLESEDGRLLFYDGDALTPLEVTKPVGSVLTLRGSLPVFFAPDRVMQYEFGPGLVPAFADVLVRDKHPDEEVLDVVYAEHYACLLLPQRLRCYRPDRSVVERAYGFAPERFVYAPFSRVFEAGAIIVRDRSGVHHRLPDDFTGEWESAPLTLKGIAPWTGGEISLEADGRVHVLDYRTRRWRDGPAGVYRRLFAPFATSTRLNAL